jgi:hypothetical protein
MKQYENTVVCLLAMLLRTESNLCDPPSATNYVIPFPPIIRAPVRSLFDAVVLSRGEYDPEVALIAVDHVLGFIWTYDWAPSETNKIPDPTLRFLILNHLQDDGRWRDSKQITPYIAKLQYMMVCGCF